MGTPSKSAPRVYALLTSSSLRPHSSASAATVSTRPPSQHRPPTCCLSLPQLRPCPTWASDHQDTQQQHFLGQERRKSYGFSLSQCSVQHSCFATRRRCPACSVQHHHLLRMHLHSSMALEMSSVFPLFRDGLLFLTDVTDGHFWLDFYGSLVKLQTVRTPVIW